ncbi:MAG: formate dehydrogenase subunit delta [Gammaproteobacteria bacterium]|nr:formate dehydrogenase subunit delta [Gammaproteobacteria bacterium]MDE0412749.1 formate dehydrogenase subunit delta [Gammaproteobacteria bacterium]
MNPAKLVRMANDIAANFDCGLDRAREVAGVVDHIGRFWSPFMLDTMARQMQAGDIGLSDLAEQALTELIEERQG